VVDSIEYGTVFAHAVCVVLALDLLKDLCKLGNATNTPKKEQF